MTTTVGETINTRRRSLLVGLGALTMAFSIGPVDAAVAEGEDGQALVPSLKKRPEIDGWIRISADNRVTVFSGKAELGQGIRTALLQIAAEELVVAPARITMVMADTERTADEGYTAGSHSVQDSGTAIRHAAAQAREILLGLAAQRLNLPVESLSVADGRISGGGTGPAAASVSYGELVTDSTLSLKAQPVSKFRDPRQHLVMGKPMQRLDIPAKVSGGAAYVQDMRLPGMVHARVVRPPSPGAVLLSVDSASVEKLPGVLKVVRDGRFLAVIGEREYATVLAARVLADAARWQESATLPDQAALFRTVLSTPPKNTVIDDRGVLGTSAGRQHSARYFRPYQLHASIGPSCAIAQLEAGRYQVWTHTQGVYPLRGALAELVGQPVETVHCMHVEGSGCYGHNAADDVAADAVLLARALPGRPVRVQWMREDEFMWEPYSPPMVTVASATLTPGGRIAEWQYGVWSNSHIARPGVAGDLLAAQHLEKPFTPSPPRAGSQPEGSGDRNAIPLYVVPNSRVVNHFLPVAPIRTSALRGLGAYMNVFSIESFMDELAGLAHVDPVEFRLRHLEDPRAIDVVHLAAERFGWQKWQPRPGFGRGFAFARYKNLSSYAAMACEVQVLKATGEVRILRIDCAVDCGATVNPDGVRNQMEGGIVQSSSWTLREQVNFDRTRITTRDWGGYPILRFPEVPRQVAVHIIDRPEAPFLGAGEAAQGPTGAAIANAVFDATGLRQRELPLSRDTLRKAFAGV